MSKKGPDDTKRFVSQQRSGTNIVVTLFILFALGFWVHALVDWAVDLGWGSDPIVLWMAPLMVAFAFVLRFFCFAIYRFVEKNY